MTAKDGAGLRVHLFTHEPYHDTPDAVYPNNWFSTHTGKVKNTHNDEAV